MAASIAVTTTAIRIAETLICRSLHELRRFRGDTGETLFTGPHQAMTGLRHLQTLIATEDRLYVAADGSIYAFGF